MTATTKQGDFTIPTVTNINFVDVRTTTQASININDITLSHDGVVYFIIERIY